jgi:hypothetical protein
LTAPGQERESSPDSVIGILNSIIGQCEQRPVDGDILERIEKYNLKANHEFEIIS